MKLILAINFVMLYIYYNDHEVIIDLSVIFNSYN